MKTVMIVGAGIVVAFLVVLYWIPLGIEPLTEVYFENHTKLRANSFPNVEYDFSFSIHNLEYQNMSYDYNVSIFDVNDLFVSSIDTGKVYLGDNETTTIFEKYNIPKGIGRARIQIEVSKDHLNITPDFKKKLWWPDPNYPNNIDIHFWTDEVVPVTITKV